MREAPTIQGLVLCGGRSVRMGTDKALLPAEEGHLLRRAIAIVECVKRPALLACGPTPRYADMQRELVLDAFPDGGPLAGLLAGLERARAQYVVALAVDMPGVSDGLLHVLLETALRDDLDVVMLSSERGDEPLCSIVHRRVAPKVRAALERGERKMTAYHSDGVRVGRLPVDAALCLNLNTPADVEAWRGSKVQAR
ncbi:MAG: molybdenum cofactor guanylyltransferase [Planctomycetota bacterium]|nr:MAG: molybdenum cofactor guanylyltransferase [Planctomycetota bacterium]